MRITNEADYALRIVSTLLGGQKKSAKTIAEETGVTNRFALKILRKLKLEGIVGSQKGASGGYYLAMMPKDISIGKIVEIIGGPFAINNCIEDGFECSRMGKETGLCSFHCFFEELNARIRNEMYAATLDRFMQERHEGR